jgi:DtxR family transcriptional regulator, Mn-dependent transcriptional regulator
MDLPVREDFLEAVLIGTLALKKAPTAGEIVERLKDISTVPEGDLVYLKQNGDIVINPDGTIELTAKGRIVAERVLKKHRVLQCFFHEMLGIDDSTASDEACILEHGVSDSTIERLGDYMEGTGAKKQEKEPEATHGLGIIQLIRQIGENGHNQPSIPARTANNREPHKPTSGRETVLYNDKTIRQKARVLSDMDEKDRIIVAGIVPGGDLHRLADLGILPGEEIRLRRKLNNNTVVVQVKGCDIALSPEIAATILVEDLS